MNEEAGSISLKITARKAYDKIGRLERELQKLMGKKASSKEASKKVTEKIRSSIAESVSLCVENVYADLILQTPKQTRFLVSNWKVTQGTPALDSVLQRPPGTSLSFPLPAPISANQINGRRRQLIYNKTSYAKRVAAGFNASGGPIKSGGGPMWFMNIGQNLSSGVYFRTALSKALARRGR